MPNEKQNRKRSKVPLLIITGVILLVLALPSYVIWEVFFQHTYDPGKLTTAADVAHFTSVAPPPEARDLRVARFDYGQARLVYVRFTAPVEVCRKYAALVVPGMTLGSLSVDQKYLDLGAIYSGANRLDDLRWFDLPYAVGGWTVNSGRPIFKKPEIDKILECPEVVGADANTEQQGYLATSVRIDQLRGVFYFLREN